ncbi:MAG: nucleotidyltransferase domain-containing protein [Spirochaetes bacterium]|nr:nucleotidyltransferase domain-containing protein [Spirochaetota bacterium]
MLNKEQILTFLKENKEYLVNNYHISIIAIYGSYARDEATEISDIDIVYEKKDYTSYKTFIEAEEYLNNNFQKKVELVNIKYMNPIIKKVAEKDFIYV